MIQLFEKEPEQFALTIEEAVKFLSVPQAAILHLIHTGVLPAFLHEDKRQAILLHDAYKYALRTGRTGGGVFAFSSGMSFSIIIWMNGHYYISETSDDHSVLRAQGAIMGGTLHMDLEECKFFQQGKEYPNEEKESITPHSFTFGPMTVLRIGHCDGAGGRKKQWTIGIQTERGVWSVECDLHGNLILKEPIADTQNPDYR